MLFESSERGRKQESSRRRVEKKSDVFASFSGSDKSHVRTLLYAFELDNEADGFEQIR